nr:immunoglobulin light chain junction region [Macaca mulatta]
CMQGIEYPVTF